MAHVTEIRASLDAGRTMVTIETDTTGDEIEGRESRLTVALPGVSEPMRATRSRLAAAAAAGASIWMAGSRGRVGCDIAIALHDLVGRGSIAWVAATAVPDALVAREIDRAPEGATVVILDGSALGPAPVSAARARPGLAVCLSTVDTAPEGWAAVRLPALADVAADVPALVFHLLARLDALSGDAASTVLPADVLTRLLVEPGEGVDDLERTLARVRAFGSAAFGSDDAIAPTATLSELERRAIEGALRRHAGVQTRAARALGVSERTLRYKLAKHGLPSSRTDS